MPLSRWPWPQEMLRATAAASRSRSMRRDEASKRGLPRATAAGRSWRRSTQVSRRIRTRIHIRSAEGHDRDRRRKRVLRRSRGRDIQSSSGVRSRGIRHTGCPVGGMVAACVVLKPQGELTAEAMTSYCRQSLANFRAPRHVELSKADLPRNSTGKVVKRLLRERLWVGSHRSVA
jgi:acyl-CoA synthetase (AMP-forming)/AMP-acid ligase II